MYRTTREIGIDAAHRVTTHGSKCAHLHGHRYTVRVTVEGGLGAGVEQGMTIDFGFLKTLMLELIDKRADHGMILWVDDPWMNVFAPRYRFDIDTRPWYGKLPDGGIVFDDRGSAPFGKLWVIPCVPTAENLAALWFALLAGEVSKATEGRCRVVLVEVDETPNCSASFGVE